MKIKLFKIGLILFFAWFFLLAAQAKADDSITVRLQIKTNDASLYDQDITVTGCSNSQTASTTTINAKCAVEQSGLSNDWSWYGEDAFLNSVGSYVNNSAGNGVYWGWFSNLEYGQVALNKHELANGEKLLLVYNTNPLKISTDNATPYVNATSTISVEQFGLDSSWNPVWSPAASSTLVIDGQEMANDAGSYIYTPVSFGQKIIYAKKDGFINSDPITMTVQAEPIPPEPVLATSTIRLQIKTNDASLYDQDITVTACSNSSIASTTSVNAKCAVEQSGLANDWSWFGDDAFLNSIGSYVNNDAGNGVYWGWFSNLEYGQVALNKHELANGEKLLLVYNTNPLKISVDNTTPFVNATSTITVEQFGLDASWNPVWSPAASSTLVIDGQNIENTSGIYIYMATTTGVQIIYGKKAGYINSDNLTVTAKASDDSNTPPPPQPGGGGGGGDVSTPPTIRVDLVKAINFLNSKQSADGSFGSALVTDWSAMAIVSVNPNGPAAQKIKSYLLTDPDPLAGMNQVSDYARRAMALMSLNINPYNGTKTNYIKKIIDSFDGRQFGDSSLYNDDIFALLVLSKAGYGENDEMIKQDVNYIISKQSPDGSWGSADLTAASVQALKSLSSSDGVSPALSKARNFLFNAQGADGGYGNLYTTPWVMQAISALGESAQNWLKNGKTPESYLALSQGSDGGLNKDDSYAVNKIWATAYVLPAVQGKAWYDILNSFAKDDVAATVKSSTNNSSTPDNLIGTSTLESATTTVATTTPDNLNQATSTPATINAATSTQINVNIKDGKDKETKAVAMPKIKPAQPKVLGKKITKISQTKNVQNKAMAETETDKISADSSNLLTPQVQNAGEKLTLKEKINQGAKKALWVAGGGTIIAGILLILKLLGVLL